MESTVPPLKTATGSASAPEASSREATSPDLQVPGIDVNDMRQDVGTQITGLFQAGENPVGMDKVQLTDVKKRRAQFVETLRSYESEPDPQVRAVLSKGLKAEADRRHNEWIKDRADLDPDQRKVLGSQNNRLVFRITTFNQLCVDRKLGLSITDRFSSRGMSEDAMIAHFKRKLKAKWDAFDKICSSYDGGAMRRSIDVAATEIAKQVPTGGALDRAKWRGKQRTQLADRVQSRLDKSGDIYGAETVKAGGFARVLAEGGDLALKYAGLSVLFSNPLLGAGLYGVRAVVEGVTGRDFADVLKGLVKVPHRLLVKGVKLARYLPAEAKVRLSEDVLRWLDEPTTVFDKTDKVSFSWKDKAKLFGRGLVPAPWLTGKIPLKGSKHVGDYIQPEKSHREASTEESFATDTAIDEACKAAFSKLKPKEQQATSAATATAGQSAQTRSAT